MIFLASLVLKPEEWGIAQVVNSRSRRCQSPGKQKEEEGKGT